MSFSMHIRSDLFNILYYLYYLIYSNYFLINWLHYKCP